MSAKSASAAAVQQVPRRAASRLPWFLPAGLLFAAFTYLALEQPPRPDAFQQVAFPQLDWWRYPIEKNAPRRLASVQCDLNAVFAQPERNKVWAAGNLGMIVASDDGGKSWTKLGGRADITSPAALLQRPRSVWAAFAADPPEQSANQAQGGKEPQTSYEQSSPKQSPASSAVPSVVGLSRDQAAAILQRVRLRIGSVAERQSNQPAGTVIQQSPAAGARVRPGTAVALVVSTRIQTAPQVEKPSQKAPSTQPAAAPRENLVAIQVQDDSRLEVTGQSGTVFRTEDGGRTWLPLPDSRAVRPSEFFLEGKRSGWRAGRTGSLSTTTDGGRSWAARATGSSADLHAVFFADANRGWLVGERGTILQSEDGGATWKPQDGGTASALRSVDMDREGRRGWIAGADGTVLHTEDGGRHWVHQTQGQRANEVNRSGDYRIRFAPWYYLSWVVWALPLVPALMRQQTRNPEVRESVADLFVSDRPLEEGDPDPMDLHSIAYGISRFLRNENTRPPLTIAVTGEWGTGKSSLMNLVKADLTKAGFRPVWFNAWHYQKEEHLLAALLQNIRIQAVPPWWTFDGIRFVYRLQWFRGARKLWPFLLTLAFSIGYWSRSEVDIIGRLREGMWTLDIDRLALLATALASFYALWQRFAAFSAKPASLMASLSGSSRVRDLDAQTSFRQKFALDFSEVTRALGNRSMIIFIDDLDRCRPQQVLEVLEAVNFLVSSGECFVVLGMARDKVEACVGLGFEEIAKEMATAPGGDPRSHRAEFARQYLDKLINIEVPVPAARKEQSEALLASTSQRASKPSGEKALLATVQRWATLVLASVIGVFALVFAFQAGNRVADVSRTVQEAAKPQQPPAAAQEAGTQRPSGGVEAAADASERAELIEPPVATRLPSLPLTLGLLAIWTAVQFVFWRAEQAHYVIKDSPEFTDALRIWHPAVFSFNSTPRAIKRFLNRVRYLAMRQQPPGTGDPAEYIPEPALVALAALQLHRPDLALDFKSPILGPLLRMHEERFEKWDLTAGQRERFLEMTRGIRVN